MVRDVTAPLSCLPDLCFAFFYRSLKTLQRHDNVAQFLGACFDFDVREEKHRTAVVLIAPTDDIQSLAGDLLPPVVDMVRALAHLRNNGFALDNLRVDSFGVDTKDAARPRAVLTDLRSALPGELAL